MQPSCFLQPYFQIKMMLDNSGISIFLNCMLSSKVLDLIPQSSLEHNVTGSWNRILVRIQYLGPIFFNILFTRFPEKTPQKYIMCMKSTIKKNNLLHGESIATAVALESPEWH